MDDVGSGSDDEFDGSKGNPSKKNNSLRSLKPAFSKKLVKMGKNAAKEESGKKKGKRIFSGVKKPEQILKNRKLKEKMAARNTPRKKKGKGGGGPGAGRGKKR